MAGNNSCGSRSIAYGNMVHNVLGIDAWLADGSRLALGPLAELGAKELALADFVHGLAERPRPEIDARWPKVLRRVAGYNLDIFHPQSERPVHRRRRGQPRAPAGRRRRHARVHAPSDAEARSALPRAKVLGVVNFPTFHAAMDAAQHIVKLGPSAVELVDRTMIELSRANPAFRVDDRRGADRSRRQAARRDPAGRVQRRRARRCSSANCMRWSN